MTLGTVAPSYLKCSRCRLTRAHSARWSPEYCPRCLAHSHVAVRLSSSALHADELSATRAATDRRAAQRAATARPVLTR